MYGSYERTHSVFQNSDMMAIGKPSEDELKLLEPYRGKVPDEVFGEPFVPPVSDGSGQDRNLLRQASQLLTKAGYAIKDGKRIGAEWRAHQDRISAGRAVASSRITRPSSRISMRSGSMPRCAWSIRCSCARA